MKQNEKMEILNDDKEKNNEVDIKEDNNEKEELNKSNNSSIEIIENRENKETDTSAETIEIGNHIKIEYINVFPYLILYGKNRQNYYNFIEDEILKSNQFYTRRCSINFIEKCLKLYSFRLFLKFNFLEIIHYFEKLCIY